MRGDVGGFCWGVTGTVLLLRFAGSVLVGLVELVRSPGRN
jgi:hypothetical protein